MNLFCYISTAVFNIVSVKLFMHYSSMLWNNIIIVSLNFEKVVGYRFLGEIIIPQNIITCA